MWETRLEEGDHRTRVALMVKAGREARESEAARESLRALLDGTPHHRQMALVALQAASDSASLLRVATRDPSLRLRTRALRAVSAVCDDQEVIVLLDHLPRRGQQKLLRLLQRKDRQDAVDGWLSRQQDPDSELLAYGSEEQLERCRAQLLERGTSVAWTRLTRRQPDWAVAAFLDGPVDGAATQRVRAVLSTLLKSRDPRLWPAWRAAVKAGYQDHISEKSLFRGCPEQAAAWSLLEFPLQDGFGCSSLPAWPYDSDARRYSFEILRELVERGEVSANYRWWSRRPLEERVQLWPEIRSSVSYYEGAIPPLWLRRLDHASRQKEARFQSELPAVIKDSRRHCEVLGMLGKEQAWEALTPFMGSPEVEERAAGTAGLVSIAFSQRETLPEVLAALLGRRHEADPVRLAFLEALSRLPPGHVEETHLPALDGILEALLAAADASGPSFQHAQLLILRLLRRFPAWSAGWLARVLRHWGHGEVGAWGVHLEAPGTAEAIESPLVSLLREWQRRERFQQLFTVVRALGTALRRMPKVQKLCRELCDSPLASTAGAALRALWSGAPEVAARLVPELLAADLSWIADPGVVAVLHRHRQDLLTPYLSGAPLVGKFASGDTTWVLRLPDVGFWRWTPNQQKMYAAQLGRLLDDPARDFLALRFGLRSLAELPDVPPRALISAAALGDESRLAVRDEALRCLARAEDGAGVQPLLDALGDERARIAIYALRSSVLALPAERAKSLLMTVDSRKVTVNKEVARLLGDLPDGVGVPVLLERLQREEHRDVRLALLRGLWPHLDREEVWEPFWRESESTDPAVGKALSAVPSTGLGRAARERRDRLMVRLLRHPSLRVRSLVLSSLSGSPTSQGHSEELMAACRGFLCQTGEDLAAAGVLFRGMLGRPERWRDLLREEMPRRRALHGLLGFVRFSVYGMRADPAYQELLKVTLHELALDPALAVERLTLYAATHSLDELLKEVEAHAETSGIEVALAWSQLIAAHTYRFDQLLWTALHRRWAEASSPVLRRFCLEALLLHTRQTGWNVTTLGQLSVFQNDPSPMVAGAAQFVFPPPLPTT